MHERRGLYHRVMRIAWVVVVVACNSSEVAREATEKVDRENREMQVQIDRMLAPYHDAIVAFLTATSKKDFAAAYSQLAPVYTNMITREQFVERIAANKNLERVHEIKIRRSSSTQGTTTVECFFGDLGAAKVTFVGTKISAISIAGTPALPQP
jgi:hypothetical protein